MCSSPEHAQLGLYIPRIKTSYQVFADGRLVGSFGGFPPNATIYDLHGHLVPLPQNQAGNLEIAIRVWHWPHWGMYFSGGAMYFGVGMSGTPRIGDASQLKDWMTLQERNTFWELSAQNVSLVTNFD